MLGAAYVGTVVGLLYLLKRKCPFCGSRRRTNTMFYHRCGKCKTPLEGL